MFPPGTLTFSLYSGFFWYSSFLVVLWLSLYIQIFPGTQVFFLYYGFFFIFRFSLVLEFSRDTLVFSLNSGFPWYSSFLLVHRLSHDHYITEMWLNVELTIHILTHLLSLQSSSIKSNPTNVSFSDILIPW